MYAVEILGQPGLRPRRPLGARPLVVGRDPDCDVVLADPSVSRRHAAIYVHDGVAWVEDLRSRNGTFVDGQRVVGSAAVGLGQVVTLGSFDALRLTDRSVVIEGPRRVLAVHDVVSGFRVVLADAPVHVGSGSGCALRLEDGPAVAGVVVRQGDDEVWVGTDDDMAEVAVDAPFVLGGRELVVVELPATLPVTIVDEASAAPLVAQAWRRAPGGLRVVLDDGTARVELLGTQNAALAYLLVRQAARDADRPAPDRGWLDDDDAAVGVWGRDGPLRQLKVLVCRLRAELREAGLDPWLVEKRRGALRLRAARAEVDE